MLPSSELYDYFHHFYSSSYSGSLSFFYHYLGDVFGTNSSVETSILVYFIFS